MPYTAVTRDSRHPFETYILTACFLAGTSAVVGDLWPSAIRAALPEWAQLVWGILLSVGALVSLIGISISNRPAGIQLEQVGLIATGSMCWTYATAILVFNSRGGFSAACLLVLIGAACFRQWKRLENFIRHAINLGEARRSEREG